MDLNHVLGTELEVYGHLSHKMQLTHTVRVVYVESMVTSFRPDLRSSLHLILLEICTTTGNHEKEFFPAKLKF